MKRIKLTNEEMVKVHTALKFYVYETTQDPERVNGGAGLPEGREKEVLEEVMVKLDKGKE